MLYRLHEVLSGGNNTRLAMGSISSLKWVSPECIAVLLAKGRISVLQPPPLSVLPDFQGEKAAEYEKQGVLDVNDMSGDEPDFEEALKWSTVGHDGPKDKDFVTAPISEDIIEISEADDDDLEPTDALIDSV